jgi:hypothetical protein
VDMQRLWVCQRFTSPRDISPEYEMWSVRGRMGDFAINLCARQSSRNANAVDWGKSRRRAPICHSTVYHTELDGRAGNSQLNGDCVPSLYLSQPPVPPELRNLLDPSTPPFVHPTIAGFTVPASRASHHHATRR